MPEPQGVEFTQESLNEIVDFSGVGHDTNDPPEDDANPDPLPRPPHASSQSYYKCQIFRHESLRHLCFHLRRKNLQCALANDCNG